MEKTFERYLKENGFKQKAIECICPHCITVADFARNHQQGEFILICSDKTILFIDGFFFGTEDSRDEIVLYYYEKETLNV